MTCKEKVREKWCKAWHGINKHLTRLMEMYLSRLLARLKGVSNIIITALSRVDIIVSILKVYSVTVIMYNFMYSHV